VNNVNNVFIIYNISPIVNSVKNVCYNIFPIVNNVNNVFIIYNISPIAGELSEKITLRTEETLKERYRFF